MRPAHAITAAGDFIVVKTDYGQHSARQWARATVGQIVQVDATATPRRREALNDLRHHMVEVVEPYFRSIPEDHLLIADRMLRKLRSIVKGTPWEGIFSKRGVGPQILFLLTRNLRSAALALN